jgi:hypothetical protein
MRNQQHRIEWQKTVLSAQAWSSCINCEYWNKLVTTDGTTREDRTGCELSGHAIPPPEVIVTGCASWEGEIPF